MLMPTLIKTRNRAGLLAMTLASLRATAPELRPWIIDDGSDDAATLAYLTRTAPAPAVRDWPADGDWRQCVGTVPEPWPEQWLPEECTVTLHRRIGIVGGHMHYTRLLAEAWPGADWLLLLEDDCRFTEGWLERLGKLLAAMPPQMAFVSLYDRHDIGRDRAALGWREVKFRPGRYGRWGYATVELASGVAYALRPGAVAGPEFSAAYPVDLTPGDTMIQCALARLGWRCAEVQPSLVQHTGYLSLYNAAHPLRFARALAGPLVDGYALTEPQPVIEWT